MGNNVYIAYALWLFCGWFGAPYISWQIYQRIFYDDAVFYGLDDILDTDRLAVLADLFESWRGNLGLHVHLWSPSQSARS